MKLNWSEIRLWVVMAVNAAAMVGCWGMLIDDSQKQHRKWEQWAKDHKCKVVSRMPGGFFDSPRTGWLCDDGVTYFK
jgi:hypothetical protein